MVVAYISFGFETVGNQKLKRMPDDFNFRETS
jgi:hypothetical protein